MLQTSLHYSLHFIAPLFIAILFFRSNWKKAYFIMLLTMAVDLDHLLASPVFDAGRCSINFHYLHRYIAIGFYTLLILFKKTRILAVGLLFHMLTDYIDCQFM